MRRTIAIGLFLALVVGCEDQVTDDQQGSGGTLGSGGAASGGGLVTGGSATTGGAGTGGGPTGGIPTGGTNTGGGLATGGTGGIGIGGAPSGGAVTGGGPTGGVSTGGGPTGGTGGGSGGAPTGGVPTGGAVSGGAVTGGVPTGGAVSGGAESGGAESGGAGSGGAGSGGAGTGGAANPLAHLIPSARDVGLLLAERFRRQALAFSSVADLPGDGYKTACEWYGALGVANLTESQDLLDGLVSKFDPLKANFVSDMTGGEAHVDRYIFGMVPLEIYLQTGDESYLPLGTQVADRQQITNQTRDAIDDMFMMTGLQLEAYRATGDVNYINFMSRTMVDYLEAQQPNGLFFHNVTEARVHWGRGNGWFAAGMAEIMRDLPASSADYPTIETGYKRMMEGLLTYQGDRGLWYQVLDMPDNASNWEESSGSAMFTYAMIAGVRRGVLDADTYVPAIEAAWAGLQTKISAQGDVSDICVGTWYKSSAQEYMALTRLTGDGHGQAPVLWAAAELLR
ncbi:MAG: glycoside hydrolase family 88 protein [Polyangiaceae bacterium]|nr:glycoside hydrolase family 88 protein [Polyangiaceae bacterium]